MAKLSIEILRQHAEVLGGRCLSNSYLGPHEKLEWACRESHTWFATPSNVYFNKRWCRICRRREASMKRRGTIADLQAIAAKNAGKCLSTEYLGSQVKHHWQCKEGHAWWTKPSHVRSGSWCPYCKKRARLTIVELQTDAARRGGQLLSKRYRNGRQRLLWRCREGHEWRASAFNVRSGKWCPFCSGRHSQSLATMRALARERGGRCVSRRYVNISTPLEWECADGHRWTAIPNNVQQGRWCRECSGSYGEKIVRAFFEQLWNDKFPPRRPEWLLSPRGYRLELDGYNENLALAFEHDGRQHYSAGSRLVPDKDALRRREALDKIKVVRCAERGIALIRIPELFYSVPLSQLKNHIAAECLRLGCELPPMFNEMEVKIGRGFSSGIMAELQGIARKREGALVSRAFIGVDRKYVWKCGRHGRFEMTARSVRDGAWCRACAGNRKYTVEDMKKIAAARGGSFLSPTYRGIRVKHLWECGKGHRWSAAPNGIVGGTWCRTCSYIERGLKQRLTLEELKAIANNRGGACLSRTYRGANEKHEWQCGRGHEWPATAASVKAGSWCRVCSRFGPRRQSR